MISVEKARELIYRKSPTPLVEKRAVQSCFFHVLAEDISAPINHPPFRQSAMDGYAIREDDFDGKNTEFHLAGESAAGNTQNISFDKGEAVRIFTGAPVPDDATAVVMQEQTESGDKTVKITAEEVKDGQNIRPVGEIIKKGEKVLQKGQVITPAGAGFLQSLGLSEVLVFKKPKTGIIITGSELVDTGKSLQYGEIYESNGITLKKALQSRLMDEPKTYRVKDDFESTKATFAKAFEECDVLIISGGISVGDYDFVERALSELGTEKIFYKVKQKPGKPMYFGLKDNKAVFALPGNPASALICLYQYVLPGLRKMAGKEHIFSDLKKAKALEPFRWKGGKSMFVRAILNEKGVRPLADQNSASLRSFSVANALIRIPDGKKGFEKGEEVEMMQLFQY